MKALYKGRLATITDCMGNPSVDTDPSLSPREYLWNMDGAVLDDELWVSFCDPDLIVDPTDEQVERALHVSPRRRRSCRCAPRREPRA